MVLCIRFSLLSLCLIPALLLTPVSHFTDNAPDVSAASCIVMAGDGQTVYEKNADERRLIASTTKLMTALVVLEHAFLDEAVTVRARHCAVEGSSMYLVPDTSYTVRELLLGLLLASGNDAASALAEHVAGSEPAFAALMNEKAAELGLTNTHYVNPHGLDDPGHYSTARDLARLMLAGLENADFRILVGTQTAGVRDQYYVNHNRLLRECPGCFGGKTGYTMAAGRCLVSCCRRDGLCFVTVTLHDPDDWRDHCALYDWAYRSYRLFDPAEALDLEVPVISGSRPSVPLRAGTSGSLLLPRKLELTLQLDAPKFVFAPVKKGETAGTIRVIIQGRQLAEYPLLYAESAEPANAL